MEKVQVVLVTGGSSGIGARTVKMLADAGMKVYAASRRGTVCDQHKNIVPITMDVTITESVEKAIAEIVKQEGHLDAIVCNAGNGIAGAVESTTVDEGKYQFETCLWGSHRTIAAALPYFRTQKHGRIVTISSVAAFVPIPYQAFYSSVKAAVLAYTEALSLELKPFNIQCCSILPGDTKTGFTSARKFTAASADESSPYYATAKASVAKMEHDEQHGMDPSVIANAILRQLKKKKMAPTVTPRIDYKIFKLLVRILPTPLKLWIIGKLY